MFYASPYDLLRDLGANKLDAALGDELGTYAKLNGHAGFTFVGPKYRLDEGIGMAVRKEDKALLRRLNEALEDVLADGGYRKRSTSRSASTDCTTSPSQVQPCTSRSGRCFARQYVTRDWRPWRGCRRSGHASRSGGHARRIRTAALAQGCSPWTLTHPIPYAFPALKEGAFDTAMVTLFPVRGFRPVRAGRLFMENLPNPVTDTVSPFPRASRMALNTALTALFACAFVNESAAGDLGRDIGFPHSSLSPERHSSLKDRDSACLRFPASPRWCSAPVRSRRACAGSSPACTPSSAPPCATSPPPAPMLPFGRSDRSGPRPRPGGATGRSTTQIRNRFTGPPSEDAPETGRVGIPPSRCPAAPGT